MPPKEDSDITYLKEAIANLEKRNSESHERLFNRLEDLEKKDSARDRDFAHMMERFGELVEDLKGVTNRLSSVEQKPAKRWDSFVGYIISAFVAGFIGFMFAKLGMK